AEEESRVCAWRGIVAQTLLSVRARTRVSVPHSEPIAQFESHRRTAGPRIGRREAVALHVHVFETAAQAGAAFVKVRQCECASMLAAQVTGRTRMVIRCESLDARGPSTHAALL